MFVVGTDRQPYQLTYDGQWQGYRGLGGALMSDPSAVAMDVNRIAVVGRGMDSGLWIKHYS